MLDRDAAERQERERLSPRAAFADATRGRELPIAPDPFRTAFQRDRDRIIHCKAFRRLSHKTQVFLAPEGDHYRTRLTHTLEVAQIARSIARALRLNEDLTEAIALAHDLGHTPFGHTGEDALTDCFEQLRADDGIVLSDGGREVRLPRESIPERFRHNVQSLRVVEHLEYDGKGLNLTWEVRDGILHHTGSVPAATLEGQIVAIADRIAYVNHDIDDAIRGGVITEDDLPAEATDVLGHTHSERISTMIHDMVEHSASADRIGMSARVWDAMMTLRQWLFDNVYLSDRAKAEEPKAYGVVQALFRHYLRNPDELPSEYASSSPDDLVQCVVDYVAGMTDRFAIRTYEQLFVPTRWRV